MSCQSNSSASELVLVSDLRSALAAISEAFVSRLGELSHEDAPMTATERIIDRRSLRPAAEREWRIEDRNSPFFIFNPR